MLICETRLEAYTVAKIASQLTSAEAPSPFPTAADTTKQPVEELPPTLIEKKREPWKVKAERLARTSPFASTEGWQLRSFIVKSNDDLRQEVFIMQMISFFKSIWPANTTWLNAYHILATGPDTGLIETITASSDLDKLKKRDGYTSLRSLFIERHGPAGSDSFLEAQTNFAKSLAGYSVVMWLLELRDRHNGNLMLDESGRYFHIDFGFCLGHSTGKQVHSRPPSLLLLCIPHALFGPLAGRADWGAGGELSLQADGRVHRAARWHRLARVRSLLQRLH